MLHGVNEYHCEKCGKKSRAERKANVQKIPSVLTLQLKRFCHGKFNESTKINHFVEYPLRLDLSPFLSDVVKEVEGESDVDHCTRLLKQKNDSLLELSSVIVHLGDSVSNGHYIAYVRSRDIKEVNFPLSHTLFTFFC